MQSMLKADKGKLKISYTKEINGKKIQIKEGIFWIQKQRQLHSMHYITPYQASFAPQIPRYFINKFTKPRGRVLDPMCGRGTVILEANQNNRIGIGFDISPLAIQIAKAKLKNVTLDEVKERLAKIDFSKEKLDDYEKFSMIYHPKTYSQILNLRKQLTDDRVDTFIKAIILGRLHGHSPGFFSVFTFNVISPRPESIAKLSKKHGAKPEFRDVVPRIIKKAKTVLKDKIREEPESIVEVVDIEELPKIDPVDLIITSPPFLAVVNYIDDNWLRFWFLGYKENDLKKLRKVLVQTDNLKEYTEFIKKSMIQMNKVLAPDGTCVIEVGDVAHQSKKLNLDELIIKLAPDTEFEVNSVLINYTTAPKISKAFSENAKRKGTKTNRCVIMKKI